MKKTVDSRKLVDAQELIDLFKKTFDRDGVIGVDEKYIPCCYYEQKLEEVKKELSILSESFQRTRSRVLEHAGDLIAIKGFIKRNQPLNN